MLGKPKYKKGDELVFKLCGEIHTGKVFVIDAFGTFEQQQEVSYDLEGENVLYKHVIESNIIRLK